MIKNKGFPFSVYSILYQACVCSISQYGSEVFGYEQYDPTFKLHLRAARAFLGLPKNVTSFGLVSELDWLLPHFQSRNDSTFWSDYAHTQTQINLQGVHVGSSFK